MDNSGVKERVRFMFGSGIKFSQDLSKCLPKSTVSRWIRSEMTGQLISDSEGAEYINQSVSRPNRQRRSQWSSLVIDKVQSLKESGLSLRKIAEELKRFPEIKTRNGKALSHTQIARILKQSS